MSLLSQFVNSAVRQVGRNVANDIYYGNTYIARAHSKFTVFLGTLLAGILSLIPGWLISGIMVVLFRSGSKGNITRSESVLIWFITIVLGFLGSWLMYKRYQKENTAHSNSVKLYRENKTKIEDKRNEIENMYINKEITKREYEVLMGKIKRMEKNL